MGAKRMGELPAFAEDVGPATTEPTWLDELVQESILFPDLTQFGFNFYILSLGRQFGAAGIRILF